MENNFEQLLKEYDYEVPQELIAQEPAEPRDSAKLLVYGKSSRAVQLDTFTNLPDYLPKNSVLIFNQTKVIPARLVLQKPNGGTFKILYTKTINDVIEVMVNKPLGIDSKLPISDAVRHPGSIASPESSTVDGPGAVDSGQSQNDEEAPFFTVIEKFDRYYHLKPSFPIAELYQVFEQYGQTPIPPYIKESPLSEKELREKYQTVFAKEKGSVAAPTASLHFTEDLIEKIKAAGHDVVFVTLHVNLGTFAPLTQKHVKEQKLHEEWYEIPPDVAEFLNKAKREARPIIAVGTTVVRTLESATCLPSESRDLAADRHLEHKIPDQSLPRTGSGVGEDTQTKLSQLSGTTTLFIKEGYQFKFITGMITNFHVPKSPLLMLVAAFVGREKLFELYNQAIKKRFRFFSFGDGMLIY